MSYTPTEWEPTDVVTATRMNALEQAVGDMNMSYTPNTWSDGDILSAAKMNALEQAVASGGGGSSDFSTANFTIVDTVGDGINIAMPVIFEAGEMGEGSPAMIFCISQSWYSGVYALTLYKGLLFLDITLPVTISGNISNIDDTIYSITGDCTITIS